MRAVRNLLVLVTATLLLLVPGSAAARDGERTATRTPAEESLEVRCLRAIDERNATLDRLQTEIAASPDRHDDALAAIVASAKTGLIVLQAAIEDPAADEGTRKADCRRIASDLRVYALRVPQIRIVMTVDALDGALAELGARRGRLGDAVVALMTDGDADDDGVHEQLTRLDDLLAHAQTTIASIDVDALLAVTPRMYNADKKVLETPVQAVRVVRDDLRQAAVAARRLARLVEAS
jgi:hypothetical protein